MLPFGLRNNNKGLWRTQSLCREKKEQQLLLWVGQKVRWGFSATSLEKHKWTFTVNSIPQSYEDPWASQTPEQHLSGQWLSSHFPARVQHCFPIRGWTIRPESSVLHTTNELWEPIKSWLSSPWLLWSLWPQRACPPWEIYNTGSLLWLWSGKVGTLRMQPRTLESTAALDPLVQEIANFLTVSGRTSSYLQSEVENVSNQDLNTDYENWIC